MGKNFFKADLWFRIQNKVILKHHHVCTGMVMFIQAGNQNLRTRIRFPNKI